MKTKCNKPFATHPVHGDCVLHMGFMHLGPVKSDKTRGAWFSEEPGSTRKPTAQPENDT